jgi:sulfite exporter TauE/SafE
MLSPAALVGAFVAGLVATAHCATMCGPLIVSATAQSRKRIPIKSLASPAGGTRYRQLGRLITYSLLGAISGGLGAALSLATSWIRFEATLYLLFNLALILIGAQLLGMQLPTTVQSLGLGLWQKLANLMRRLKPQNIMVGEIFFGMLWGLVPCAAIYAVLPLALLTGTAQEGAMLMLVFGLGTVPGHLLLFRSWGAATRLGNGWRTAWVPRALGAMIVIWGVAGASFAAGLTRHPSALLLAFCGVH